MISDAELAQIEAWGAMVLTALQRDQAWVEPFTIYTEHLPSHSVRSQMLGLSSEVRRLRTALAQCGDGSRDASGEST